MVLVASLETSQELSLQIVVVVFDGLRVSDSDALLEAVAHVKSLQILVLT